MTRKIFDMGANLYKYEIKAVDIAETPDVMGFMEFDNFCRVAICTWPMIPLGEVWFTDNEGNVRGKIVNIGKGES